MQNPIVLLNEKCQKTFGENPIFNQLSVVGQNHCPTITCELILPNGKKYQVSSTSQKDCKKQLSELALSEWENVKPKKKQEKKHRGISYKIDGHQYNSDSIDGMIEHFSQNGYNVTARDGSIYEVGEYYPIGSYFFV